ncbi:MAG: hypothetical protein K8T25_06420 [Planctomycetia bacterium]|nr:hypothetical protein [Planctomycetia bacterium]
MISEKELLVDCLKRLGRSGLDYMLVGSMASNYWGIPRSTHDLDFVVRLRAADVPALVNEFQQDFFIQPESVRAALKPPYQFNALDERSALKVDFWVLHESPFEQQAFDRRRMVTLFETPACLSSAEDVILHKLYWNKLSPSDRQLGDSAGVFAVQQSALDMEYMQLWSEKLGVVDVWQKIIAGKIRPKDT